MSASFHEQTLLVLQKGREELEERLMRNITLAADAGKSFVGTYFNHEIPFDSVDAYEEWLSTRPWLSGFKIIRSDLHVELIFIHVE